MADGIPATPPGSRILTMLHKANTALSVDFCPSFNRYVYWLKSPFWILMLATGGSALCGLLVNPLVFILTGILVLVATVGVLLPWMAVRGIECAVVFDVSRTRVGEPALVRLQVTNRWPLPVWGLSLIRGFTHDATPDGDGGVALARVPGWSTVEYSWPFSPRRRGLYPCGTAEVETGFPFGLFHARKPARVDGQLIVWPETARLNGIPDSSESPQAEDQFCNRRAGDSGDMTGTRPFRCGDSLRRVHWAQTARQQTMIVTERQAPAMTSVRVAIDFSEEAHPEATEDITVERCVQVAASVCESLHRQRSRVELAVGDQVLVAGDAASGFRQVMDTLSVAQRHPLQTPHASRRQGFEIRVTTTHGQRPDHRGQIIVDAEPGGSGAWMELSARHAVISQLPECWRRVCHDT